MGFGVWDLGFGVWGLGFRVWGSGLRLSGLFRVGYPETHMRSYFRNVPLSRIRV